MLDREFKKPANNWLSEYSELSEAERLARRYSATQQPPAPSAKPLRTARVCQAVAQAWYAIRDCVEPGRVSEALATIARAARSLSRRLFVRRELGLAEIGGSVLCPT
jgi:hypothetical protein